MRNLWQKGERAVTVGNPRILKPRRTGLSVIIKVRQPSRIPDDVMWDPRAQHRGHAAGSGARPNRASRGREARASPSAHLQARVTSVRSPKGISVQAALT